MDTTTRTSVTLTSVSPSISSSDGIGSSYTKRRNVLDKYRTLGRSPRQFPFLDGINRHRYSILTTPHTTVSPQAQRRDLQKQLDDEAKEQRVSLPSQENNRETEAAKSHLIDFINEKVDR